MILHHHERFDGGGYPAGLAGDATSRSRPASSPSPTCGTRSRPTAPTAWAGHPHMALAHIRDGAGTHFDPRVVAALTRLVAGWGIDDTYCEGAASVAWTAAETCHEVDERHPVSV